MLVLPLEHPLVLLPGARVSLSLPDDIADQLVEASNTTSGLTLAATPITIPKSNDGSEDLILNEWACTARVLRLVRPSVLSQSDRFVVTVVGRERVRVKLTQPFSYFPKGSESHGQRKVQRLPDYTVEYQPAETTPKKEIIADFKGSALKLLDRLVLDADKTSRRDLWKRFATMVEEVSDSRTPWLSDIMVVYLLNKAHGAAFLSLTNNDDRLRRATELFIKQTSISEVTKKISSAVDESLSRQQKEFFLRQQLAAIQRELANLDGSSGGIGGHRGSGIGSGDSDGVSNEDDLSEIKRELDAMMPGSEERKMGEREWKRLKRIPQQSAEHGVIQNYLEWLTSLPWPKEALQDSKSAGAIKSRSFLKRAREQLDADHHGLDKIKKRLIEYLAVLRLRQISLEAEQKKEPEADKENHSPEEGSKNAKALVLTSSESRHSGATDYNQATPEPKQHKKSKDATAKGPILLFVGPPGTGKTSLGQSIARALDRPFQRISLGGVRDEAEIRGHRRTYIASGPGLIAQALRKAGRLDPVILLDEVDKVGPSNFHGDVAAAMLEVLDPEQNHSFNDHYINVPIDLSQVLFICTANTLETMSAPLLDRCEIVTLSGYTYPEKSRIARRFLLPKQLRANALDSSQLALDDEVLQKIISGYTHEAGVRSLERAIGAVVRFKAVEWAEAVDAERQASYDPQVRPEDLENILGIARWDGDEREREPRRGVVYGLVVMGAGEGGVLPIETTAVPGSGNLKLTGSLGDVIRESAELALSWVKAHAYAMSITNEPAHDPLRVPDVIDVHLHLPAGAQKKDGPSAGIAMICAFVSLLTGALVPPNTAMTGEVTLRGRVTPVGGIKEKVLGAHRAGITKLILPIANRREYEQDLPEDVKGAVESCFVSTIEEALEAAFGRGVLRWKRNGGVGGRGGGRVFVESRL